MAEPKKQKSKRKTGLGRSHLLLKLARRVNGTSPVKARTTKRETGKVKKVVAEVEKTVKKTVKKAKKTAASAK
jgi:hypothetical protein